MMYHKLSNKDLDAMLFNLISEKINRESKPFVYFSKRNEIYEKVNKLIIHEVGLINEGKSSVNAKV